MTDTWRLDPIDPGRVAWLYLIPHAVDWSIPSGEAEHWCYTVTETAHPSFPKRPSS